MLESGFTTVRDVGNAGNYADTSLRVAIEEVMVPGPTVINDRRIIAPFVGQYHLSPKRRGLGEPEYFYADTRDEMMKANPRERHFRRAGHQIASMISPYIYSVDDIKFMVAEAARRTQDRGAHA